MCAKRCVFSIIQLTSRCARVSDGDNEACRKDGVRACWSRVFDSASSTSGVNRAVTLPVDRSGPFYTHRLAETRPRAFERIFAYRKVFPCE